MADSLSPSDSNNPDFLSLSISFDAHVEEFLSGVPECVDLEFLKIPGDEADMRLAALTESIQWKLKNEPLVDSSDREIAIDAIKVLMCEIMSYEERRMGEAFLALQRLYVELIDSLPTTQSRVNKYPSMQTLRTEQAACVGGALIEEPTFGTVCEVERIMRRTPEIITFEEFPRGLVSFLERCNVRAQQGDSLRVAELAYRLVSRFTEWAGGEHYNYPGMIDRVWRDVEHMRAERKIPRETVRIVAQAHLACARYEELFKKDLESATECANRAVTTMHRLLRGSVLHYQDAVLASECRVTLAEYIAKVGDESSYYAQVHAEMGRKMWRQARKINPGPQQDKIAGIGYRLAILYGQIYGSLDD